MLSEKIQDRALPGITNIGEAIFMAAVGEDLGLTPMQSIRGMHLVKGKPILAAQTIHAIVVKRRDICKYLRLVESTHEKCTYETLRDGDPAPTTLTWTIQMAQRAGLLQNPTWKNHPEAMLRARCISAICRAVYPDLVLGVYDEDEGREIAGDYRVLVQEPVVSLPDHYARKLPAAAPDPLAAFAPLPNEPSELDQTVIGQMAATIAAINACTTVAELQACAATLKGNPLAKEGTATRSTLLEAHKRRRTEIQVSEILDETTKPGADLAALWTRAKALHGVTQDQEIELATACGVAS
jgi:RecT family